MRIAYVHEVTPDLKDCSYLAEEGERFVLRLREVANTGVAHIVEASSLGGHGRENRFKYGTRGNEGWKGGQYRHVGPDLIQEYRS